MSRIDFGYGVARENGQIVALITVDYEDEEQSCEMVLDLDEAEQLIEGVRSVIAKSREQHATYVKENAS